MMLRRNALVPYLLIAVIGGAIALSVTSRSRHNRQAVRQAGISFATAVQTNDQDAIRNLATGSEVQFQYVAAMSRWTAAYKNYESAFAKRFADGHAPFLQSSQTLIQQVESADPSIDGNTATLTSKTGSQTLQFTKSRGTWKLDLASISGDSEAAGQITTLNGLAGAYDESRKEIEAGKIKAAETAARRLKHRLDEVLAKTRDLQFNNKKIPIPSTGPATQPTTSPATLPTTLPTTAATTLPL